VRERAASDTGGYLIRGPHIVNGNVLQMLKNVSAAGA
jgi:hypothetical protein